MVHPDRAEAGLNASATWRGTSSTERSRPARFQEFSRGAPAAEAEASKSPATSFLQGGGEMGARMRAHDWVATPLGPLSDWPQSLRSALGICLNSPFPAGIYWGPELRVLYNDAWSVFLADRHPWALGRPCREVWSEVWSVLEPQFARVMATGEGFSTENQMLRVERHGRIEETW